MSKRKPVTAAELMAELEADPEWVARRDAKEREREGHRQVCVADQTDLVREIRDAGYDIDSVWDLVNNTPHPVLERRFLGEYPSAYPILVRHLFIPHLKEILEGIITHLGEPLEPPPLAAARGPPTDWGELVQIHDDRDVSQASPDELPAIDINSL